MLIKYISKLVLTIILSNSFFFLKGQSQGIEIAAYAGYTFADMLNFTDGGWGRIGAGVGIFEGNDGANTRVSTFTAITQFGFKGGLIFRLSK